MFEASHQVDNCAYQTSRVLYDQAATADI